MQANFEVARREQENAALRSEQEAQDAVIARQRQGFILGGILLLLSGALVLVLLRSRRESQRTNLLLSQGPDSHLCQLQEGQRRPRILGTGGDLCLSALRGFLHSRNLPLLRGVSFPGVAGRSGNRRGLRHPPSFPAYEHPSLPGISPPQHIKSSLPAIFLCDTCVDSH
jgi:hypothetical protein